MQFPINIRPCNDVDMILHAAPTCDTADMGYENVGQGFVIDLQIRVAGRLSGGITESSITCLRRHILLSIMTRVPESKAFYMASNGKIRGGAITAVFSELSPATTLSVPKRRALMSTPNYKVDVAVQMPSTVAPQTRAAVENLLRTPENLSSMFATFDASTLQVSGLCCVFKRRLREAHFMFFIPIT